MYLLGSQFVLISCLFYYLTLGIWVNFVDPTNLFLRDLLSDTYFLIALVSGVCCIFAAYRWNVLYNNIGRALLITGFGLFLQAAGQVSYSIYYILFSVDNPYATFGDTFYISSLLVIQFALLIALKGVGIKVSSKFMLSLCVLQILGIYFGTLIISSNFNLYDSLSLSYIIFGVTNALLGILLTKQAWSMLYGGFRTSFILMVVALISLLCADVSYIVNTIQGSWMPGDISDILYLMSYSLFGLSGVVLGEKFYFPYNEPITVYFSYESLI